MNRRNEKIENLVYKHFINLFIEYQVEIMDTAGQVIIVIKEYYFMLIIQ